MNTPPRESPYPMVSTEEAMRLIQAHIQPLGTEQISTLFAAGRVLAEDIDAPEDVPDLPTAMVDGYALRSADGMAERQVLGEAAAGTSEAFLLSPGTAVRIMTGAPVPPGADTVVMIEQTQEHDGWLHLQQPVQAGQHIRVVGDDMRQGQPVLKRGTLLGAAEIGLLATLGCTCLQIYRQPRVAVLSTGSEVVEPDAPRRPGMVRDSNRYALLAAVREAGAEGLSLGIAYDDAHVQRTAILEGLAQADMLITSGGVSMGTYDLVKPLLAELGTIHFGRVATKPGKPTTFATVQGKPVFGMPGFPVSSLVAFEVYVRPALRRMQGDRRPERPRVRVMLAEPMRPAHNRTDYQRARVVWQDGRLVAQSAGPQTSSRLLSLHHANALLIVPPGADLHAPGDELNALLIGPLL